MPPCEHRDVEATLARLEAALAASWDRDTLAVYADRLVERGDPRGELIAIDLQLEQHGTPELAARRASLLSAWLGRHAPSDPHGSWIGDSFRFGFVENLVVDDRNCPEEALGSLFDSPLAPYVRRLTIHGGTSYVTRVAHEIARCERAWLAKLTVDFVGRDPIVEPTIEPLIAATPRLEELDVRGLRAFETFPHPALRILRVSGWMALPKLCTARGNPVMTGVTALDLAFYDSRWNSSDEYRIPVELVAPGAFPALRVLDLSRNEPADPDDDPAYRPEEAVLAVLHRFALHHQLTRVRLPSLRSDAEFATLSAVVAGMPALVEIEIARGHYYRAPELAHATARFRRPPPWPWPRVDDPGEGLHVMVPGSHSGDTLAIADAVAVMERRFEDLPADARYAWTRFWVLVDELGRSEWRSDAERSWTEDRQFPADTLIDALEACEIDGTGGWRELRDELRFRRPLPAGAVVAIHRIRTAAE